MTSQRIRPRQSGFTLMEVLLVMVILVVLASFAVVAIGPMRRNALEKAAKAQVGMFHTPLESYMMDVGSYPTTLEALRSPPGDLSNPSKWQGPYLSTDVPLDPWEHQYQYQTPGAHNPDSYDVWTINPYNGQEIGNWTQR